MPSLHTPDLSRPFLLFTDASATAIGACLAQTIWRENANLLSSANCPKRSGPSSVKHLACASSSDRFFSNGGRSKTLLNHHARSAV
ncbi:hypothetical protein TNCV_4498901 [Trichonephila clavipes]|nr:hypothetical protein TNCV_4498901 [Trichonephila clavipes]